MYKKNRRTRRKSIRRVVRKDAIQKSVGKNRRSIRKSVRRKNTSTRKSTRRKSRTKRKSTRRKSRTKRRSVRRGSWANIRKTLWRKNQYGGFVEGFDPLEQGSCSQLGGVVRGQKRHDRRWRAAGRAAQMRGILPPRPVAASDAAPEAQPSFAVQKERQNQLAELEKALAAELQKQQAARSSAQASEHAARVAELEKARVAERQKQQEDQVGTGEHGSSKGVAGRELSSETESTINKTIENKIEALNDKIKGLLEKCKADLDEEEPETRGEAERVAAEAAARAKEEAEERRQE